MADRLRGAGLRGTLRGRATECALLDRLLSAIRRGESQSLVLRGEAGIGKTALLMYLVDSASDLDVRRAVGVESEMELAYASLHQLCGPMLDRVDGLPAPQRDALRLAFGLTAGPPPDRFMVGLAALSLLSEAGAKRPVTLRDRRRTLARSCFSSGAGVCCPTRSGGPRGDGVRHARAGGIGAPAGTGRTWPTYRRRACPPEHGCEVHVGRPRA